MTMSNAIDASCGLHLSLWDAIMLRLYLRMSNVSDLSSGADPGGGPDPSLTLGFEAQKLSIFGPYLIFPYFFLPCFAQHIISLICCFSKFKFKNFPASLHSAYDFSRSLFLVLVSHILGY